MSPTQAITLVINNSISCDVLDLLDAGEKKGIAAI